MNIQGTTNLNFNAKLKTIDVLETTSLHVIQSEGLNGVINVVKTLNNEPIKATGSKGYRYYAKIIGEKITEKYPPIKEATNKIKDILKKNPRITKQELEAQIHDFIERIGNEIDIII